MSLFSGIKNAVKKVGNAAKSVAHTASAIGSNPLVKAVGKVAISAGDAATGGQVSKVIHTVEDAVHKTTQAAQAVQKVQAAVGPILKPAAGKTPTPTATRTTVTASIMKPSPRPLNAPPNLAAHPSVISKPAVTVSATADRGVIFSILHAFGLA